MEREAPPLKLIIIELRLRHKHIWKAYLPSEDECKWYLPRSWVEVEEVIRDYDAKAWDDHFHHLTTCSSHPDRKQNPHLKRLVLDPTLDLCRLEIVSSTYNKKRMWSPFGKAFEYLLTDKSAPSVVEYRRWRKEYVEGLLNSTSASTKQLLCSNSAGDCTFKYTTTLEVGAGGVTVSCRACEQQILAGESSYMCVSCSLALHKSCAEFPPLDFYYDVNRFSRIGTFVELPVQNPGMKLRSCKSCMEFSYECGGGCIFETHLKCRLMPTVVDNPHLHPHPLSLRFLLDKEDRYSCELCALAGVNCGYYCVICNSYYDLRCAHSSSEVEHEHGGHRHHVKLILPTSTSSTSTEDQLAFCSDDYLDPDDMWCDVCYKDLNSQAEYYACQDCPDYVAHIICISPTCTGMSILG